MIATASGSRSTSAGRRRPLHRGPPRRAPARRGAEPYVRTNLDTIAARWQRALDHGQRALDAAADALPGAELGRRRHQLAQERQRTATMLAGLARDLRVQPAPWISPVPLTPGMLGLQDTVSTCLFDLDDVLTDSGVAHATAWAVVFDELLQRIGERTGWQPHPFDRESDYRAYIDGRPRLEGIHAFLDSRGIRLPEGRPQDPAGADTAYGLAKRKSDALARELRRRGVTAVPGARRYLEAAGHAGLRRGVISASTRTSAMLELAGLESLVEAHVDGDVIAGEGLHSRPAPDVLLAACRRLGVPPGDAVSFTHTPAGVAAAHAAGVMVVGLGDDEHGEVLRGFGAERVVHSLTSLLDPRLADRSALDPGSRE
jgi:beta-phosphoglucomutase-like phosphatase (HAD superfamily)